MRFSAEEVLENEIRPTNPLFYLVSSAIDREQKLVTSTMLGMGQSLAAYRDGLGCSVLPDGPVALAVFRKAGQGITPPGQPGLIKNGHWDKKPALHRLLPGLQRKKLRSGPA